MAGQGAGTHTLHDPTDSLILNAAEVPTFHGNSLPIPTFGSGSAYPTITPTRPRAHTSADSSPSGLGAGTFGGLQPRQPSRNSMMQGHHPGGMGLRHVSASILDSGGRVRGDGGGGGGSGAGGGGSAGAGFPMGSPPQTKNGMPLPPPPPPPLPKDAGYVPLFVPRSHPREGTMNYHYAHPPQYSGAYHQSASSSTSSLPQSQLPPLSVSPQNAYTNGNNNMLYTPHSHPHPHSYTHSHPHSLPHPHRSPPEVPQMYRQQSAQSSDSIGSSFTRTESNADSEYMTPATTASGSMTISGGNRSVSNQLSPGITRSSHVSHSHVQQSPLASVSSTTTGPHSPDVATVWTLETVVAYLNRHELSAEWQEAFRNLNIHGGGFLEMGQHNSTSLFQHVLPEVLRICGPNADPVREKIAAKNIKKMVREILKLSQEIPNTPPSSGVNVSDNGESPGRTVGAAQRSPNQPRFPVQRGATFPANYPDGTHHGSDPFLPRGNEHRAPLPDSRARTALAGVDHIQRRPSPSSEVPSRDTDNHMFGKQPPSNSPRNSPHPGYQPISSRHGKSNSQESVASSTASHRAGDGKGKEKALLVLGITRDERPVNRSDHEVRSSGASLVGRWRKKFRRENAEDDGNEDDSPTSPGWRPPGLPFAIPENNTSDSSLDRTSLSSVDGVRSRVLNLRSAPVGTARSSRSVFVFATKNGRVWVSVDLTNLDKGAAIRKEICRNMGINDYDTAAIHLTEVGQEPNGEQQ